MVIDVGYVLCFLIGAILGILTTTLIFISEDGD